MMKPFCAAFVIFFAAGLAQSQVLRADKIKNPRVSYAPAARMKRLPVPAIVFERAGLARRGDQDEIIERIVYPAINKSEKPVAALVITFLPDRPDITVLLILHGGDYAGALIERDENGHFSKNAYMNLFPDVEL